MLTDWYPPDQKPVRIGPYQRRYGRSIVFSWWNGVHFGLWSGSLEDCISDPWREEPSSLQDLEWRGLTEGA